MPSVIVNYWTSRTRPSPLNIAVVRVLLGVFLIWKVLSYDWNILHEWPTISRQYYNILLSETSFRLLPFEAGIVVALTLVFIVGYRIRLTSFLLALGVSHLTLHRWVISSHGDTEAFFIIVYFIVLFGLFAETDVISIDGLRRTNGYSMDELNDKLQSNYNHTHSMAILQWSLLIVAIIYFGSGFAKIVNGPIWEWVQMDTIPRFITHREVVDGMQRPVGAFIADHPYLSLAGAAGTILLEVGFLVAVLLGFSLVPVVIGLIGAHIVIAVSLGPFFFDQIFILLLFSNWDIAHSRLSSGRQLDIVYDGRCSFCARSLYLFQILDIDNTVTFYSQDTAPGDYQGHDGADFEGALYAFSGEDVFEGYDAWQVLLSQFGFLRPVAFLLQVPGVSHLGERVYRYIAANRNRHFTRSIGK